MSTYVHVGAERKDVTTPYSNIEGSETLGREDGATGEVMSGRMWQYPWN